MAREQPPRDGEQGPSADRDVGRPIKAVIFDVGHTLVRPGISPFTLLRDLGLDVTPDQVHRAVRPAMDEFWRRMGRDRELWASDATIHEFWMLFYHIVLSHLGVPEERHRELAEKIYRAYLSHHMWDLFPEVEDVLSRLHGEGYILGAVSDWQSTLLELLGHLELVRYLDFVVVSAIVGAGKPDPSLFHEALRRAGVRPEEALFVGDTYVTDILGARAAGMYPVLVDRSRRPAPVDCDLVRDLTGLFDVLARLNAAPTAAGRKA